jgi:purine nucleoside permease
MTLRLTLCCAQFEPETTVWWGVNEFNTIARNISLPGLSPIHPYVHCAEDYAVCQVTTGETEINAATTIAALTLSSFFDLTKTYFLIAGIAGMNPEHRTTGAVVLVVLLHNIGRDASQSIPPKHLRYGSFRTE